MTPSMKDKNTANPNELQMQAQAMLNDLLAVQGKSPEEQRKVLSAKYGDYYTKLRQMKKAGYFNNYNTMQGHDSNEESIGTNDWKKYAKDPNASHQNMTKAWIDQLGLPKQAMGGEPAPTPPAPIQTGQIGASIPRNLMKVQGGYADYLGNFKMTDEEYNQKMNQQNQKTPMAIDPNTGKSFDNKRAEEFASGGKIALKDMSNGGLVKGPTHGQGGVPTFAPGGEMPMGEEAPMEQIAEVEGAGVTPDGVAVNGGERIFSVEDTQAIEQMVAEYQQSQDQNTLLQLGQYVAQAVMNQEQVNPSEEGMTPDMMAQGQIPMGKMGMKIPVAKRTLSKKDLINIFSTI